MSRNLKTALLLELVALILFLGIVGKYWILNG